MTCTFFTDDINDGECDNLPAVLIDSGVVTQMGQPRTVMKGYIKQDSVPTGPLHKFADDIRMS
jgi:type IV pilus assembly protein PilY1